ncbi:MAG: hypothetical protein OEW83_22530 [Acidimicrobiia bacterium]|nr:hypothetical protein [Acidimicrobiia bacterium]
MIVDKSEIEIVAELEPSIAPRVCILRHKPTGEIGVGAAASAHEARDKAVKVLLDKIPPPHEAPLGDS